MEIAKAIADIQEYLKLIPAVNRAPQHAVWLTYDAEADTLYVNYKKPSHATDSEMTDEDARRIMNSDLKVLKHKEAGEKLNLSYGQIYSCRRGFTFKHIHKELAAIAGYKNAWMK